MTAACAYPLFRERFLRGSEGDGGESEAGAPDPAATSERAPGSARGGGGSRAGTARGLAVLDLRSLPREDGPPSELRARKDKLAFFDRQCTRVAEGLFVGGETVARSRELLAGSGITHVVNCVGFLYPAFFQDELRYKVLFLQGAHRPGLGPQGAPGAPVKCRACGGWPVARRNSLQGASDERTLKRACVCSACIAVLFRLLGVSSAWWRSQIAGPRGADTPGEDILCVLYDVFDFIEVGLDQCKPCPPCSHCAERHRWHLHAALQVAPCVIVTPGPSTPLAGRGGRQCAGALLTGRVALHRTRHCIPDVEDRPLLR